MKYFWYVFILFFYTPVFAEPASSVVTPINMFVGESRVFEESNVKRVAIGAADLVTVQELEEGSLLVMADAPGSTTVHIWYKNEEWAPRVYNIRVREEDPATRIRSELMIRFNVKLVEFRKAALRDLGIDWSNSVEGPSGAIAAQVIDNNLFSSPVPEFFSGLPNQISGLQGSLGLASTITSRINFLASNGNASTIAEPILMCLNGGEADFHAGGELPLPVRDEDGFVTVEFRPYGIRLSVQPLVNDEGVIDTIISTEVSEIDNSVAVENIPGLITRNTTTRVQVQHGESIILAGLLSENLSSDKSAIPGLGNIPGVGKAFSNKVVRETTTELVIFLQPEVIGLEGSTDVEESVVISDELRLSQWKNKLRTNMVD